MTPKLGDTRILAEWCQEWPTDSDGEFYRCFQKYESVECDTMEEAAKLADSRDIFGEGRIVIEEYVHLGWGVCDWEEIESMSTADWRERRRS